MSAARLDLLLPETGLFFGNRPLVTFGLRQG